MTDPILSMRNVSKVYSARRASGWGKTTVRAVDDLDLFEQVDEELVEVEQ